MFTYIENKDIDYSLWDRCIFESMNGNIYALSWYLDIVSPHWAGLIKEFDGKYGAVFPLTCTKRLNLKYLSQPLFSQQLGLFYTERHQPSQQDYLWILSFLDKNFDLISGYNFNIHNEKLDAHAGFQVETLKTYHLKLSKPYDEIRKNYKKDKKYRLSQLKNTPLKIVPSIDIYGLMGMFNENTAHDIPGVKGNLEIYNTLKDIFTEASYRKMCLLFEVRNRQNESVGMAMFLLFENDLVYFFSTQTEEGKKAKSIIFLLDHVIKSYAESDWILDFEGSHVPGIAAFYEGFGAEKREFPSIQKNNLPPIIKALKKIKTLL